MKRNYSILVVLLSSVLLIGSISGCEEKNQPRVTETVDSLTTAELALMLLDSLEEIWAAKKPDRYEYVITRGCFCSPANSGPFLIRFSGQLVDTAFYYDWERIKASAGIYENFDSAYVVSQVHEQIKSLLIDSVFSTVRRTLVNDPDSFFITYHPDFSFPDTVYLDPSFEMADEELGILIREFAPLN